MQENNLDTLTNFICVTYHEPLKKDLLQVVFLLEKMLKVHGKAHPELFEIHKSFQAFKTLILQHMKKEENVLFPYMRALQLSFDTGKFLPETHFQTVQKPITQMEKEHQEIDTMLENIKQITNHFSLPEGACQTYQKCFSLLEKIYFDTQKHADYENTILHKYALEVEQKIKK